MLKLKAFWIHVLRNSYYVVMQYTSFLIKYYSWWNSYSKTILFSFQWLILHEFEHFYFSISVNNGQIEEIDERKIKIKSIHGKERFSKKYI